MGAAELVELSGVEALAGPISSPTPRRSRLSVPMLDESVGFWAYSCFSARMRG